MSKTIIPANYTPALNLYDTQRAIGTVKRLFADTLCATLNLYRVSAPLFLEASTGLNDDLNGVERKVTFDIKDSGTEAQVFWQPAFYLIIRVPFIKTSDKRNVSFIFLYFR